MRYKDSSFNIIFTKDVWTLVSGSAISQILLLAFVPVLTRLFCRIPDILYFSNKTKTQSLIFSECVVVNSTFYESVDWKFNI